MRNRILAIQQELLTNNPKMKKVAKASAKRHLHSAYNKSNYDKYLPIIGRVLRNGQPVSGAEVAFVQMVNDTGQRMNYQVHTGSSITNQNGEFFMGIQYENHNFAAVTQATIEVTVNTENHNMVTQTGIDLRAAMGAVFPTTTMDAILTLLKAPNPFSLISTNFVGIAAIKDITIQ